MGTRENSIKVLVTGGGGFVGLALVKKLVSLGFDVSSFSRQEYPELQALGVRIFRGDLANHDAVNEAIMNQEIVFHVAAKAGFWGSYKDYHETNVLGTQNVTEACQKFKIRSLIYTSSASVIFAGHSIENGNTDLPYPEKALSHYTKTKALAEQIVLKANSEQLRTICLRPHIIWGPGDRHIIPRLLQRAKADRLRIIGKGTNRIDTIFIDNLIDAHINALESLDSKSSCRGKIYFVSNDDPVLMWEFINKILERAGMDKIQKKIPTRLALFIASISSAYHLAFIPDKEPLLTPFLIKELSQSHWFDISNTKKDLGYAPRITNEEGLGIL
ncbi:MAG: NAD-dependent epimerase/dehydratase family protein [Bacteroidales bacterium]|nr:NAD-dependent epimerase/dehydratase family protein [Bacteroidales bacterium]